MNTSETLKVWRLCSDRYADSACEGIAAKRVGETLPKDWRSVSGSKALVARAFESIRPLLGNRFDPRPRLRNPAVSTTFVYNSTPARPCASLSLYCA